MLSPNTERLVASSGLPLQTATMSLCAVIVRSSVWKRSICSTVTPKVKFPCCFRSAAVLLVFEVVMTPILDVNGRDIRSPNLSLFQIFEKGI